MAIEVGYDQLWRKVTECGDKEAGGEGGRGGGGGGGVRRQRGGAFTIAEEDEDRGGNHDEAEGLEIVDSEIPILFLFFKWRYDPYFFLVASR